MSVQHAQVNSHALENTIATGEMEGMVLTPD